MQLLLSVLFVSSIFISHFSYALTQEFTCAGETEDHHFFATVELHDKRLDIDLLQSTQYTQTPFPLLPLRHILKDLEPTIKLDKRVYEFAPSNYQSCSYKWIWPQDLSETMRSNSEGEMEVETILKLDCDGVKSKAEITCQI